jgi:hypothetical protein
LSDFIRPPSLGVDVAVLVLERPWFGAAVAAPELVLENGSVVFGAVAGVGTVPAPPAELVALPEPAPPAEPVPLPELVPVPVPVPVPVVVLVALWVEEPV